MNEILAKLQRLHDYQHVHCDIKPNNIMERKLDHLYRTDFIEDGWLLIDFSSMTMNGTKGSYKGSMGWTAPEIDYNSNKNIYRYSSDIFSFGLVILYVMFGHQPLEIPRSKQKQFQIKSNDDEQEILRKKALKAKMSKNWYCEHIKKSENYIKNYLVKLYYENKISLSLFKLLHDGVLIYDHKKRLNCKEIYNSEWLRDLNGNK